MPYETVGGSYERASRLSHSSAVVRAIAEKRNFFVPCESLSNAEEVRKKVRQRASFALAAEMLPLSSALAVDGSYFVAQVRDGLPSVLYGFSQVVAAYLDIRALETQKSARFVDPFEIEHAVRSALVNLDLPVAGAYTREGVNIKTSWREAIYSIFSSKRVEFNRFTQTLLELLLLLHGEPGKTAVTVPAKCPSDDCDQDVAVPAAGTTCDKCGAWIYPTDVLRIHEETGEEGGNEGALGRLTSVIELLVLVGLATFLWEHSRHEVLPTTIFIVDGPLAMHGPTAKLHTQALEYFQAMGTTTPGNGPYICGLEKSGTMVDFAQQLARHDILRRGELLVCDAAIIARVTNAANARSYGKETYWGRKFIYRTLDGRVLVPTVMPSAGAPYDANGGQSEPENYPTLPAILNVIERTGSTMFVNGIIPVAVAHGKAAFPIGVGTDVLRLAAKRLLGLGKTAGEPV